MTGLKLSFGELGRGAIFYYEPLSANFVKIETIKHPDWPNLDVNAITERGRFLHFKANEEVIFVKELANVKHRKLCKKPQVSL